MYPCNGHGSCSNISTNFEFLGLLVEFHYVVLLVFQIFVVPE